MLRRAREHPGRVAAVAVVVCMAAAAALWVLDGGARVPIIEALVVLVIVTAVWAGSRLSAPTPAAGVAPARLRDLALPERTLREVRTLIALLASRRAARRHGVELPTGALLVGPPGVGKMLLARVIATEARRSFFALDAGNTAIPYAGEAAMWVYQVFAAARAQAPAVVFFDERDGIAASRRQVGSHGGEAAADHRRAVDALLAAVEGVTGAADVFVIGATNHPDALDPAVRSRVSYVVHVDPPDLAGRAQILRQHWPRWSRGIDPLTVAMWTNDDRLSGRDCRARADGRDSGARARRGRG